MYKSLMSFVVVPDVYMSFIPNETTFTKHCHTQWISKLPRNFEISLLSFVFIPVVYMKSTE